MYNAPLRRMTMGVQISISNCFVTSAALRFSLHLTKLRLGGDGMLTSTMLMRLITAPPILGYLTTQAVVNVWNIGAVWHMNTSISLGVHMGTASKSSRSANHVAALPAMNMLSQSGINESKWAHGRSASMIASCNSVDISSLVESALFFLILKCTSVDNHRTSSAPTLIIAVESIQHTVERFSHCGYIRCLCNIIQQLIFSCCRFFAAVGAVYKNPVKCR